MFLPGFVLLPLFGATATLWFVRQTLTQWREAKNTGKWLFLSFLVAAWTWVPQVYFYQYRIPEGLRFLQTNSFGSWEHS